MEKIPDQSGYLIMTMDGAVISSGGDLENNERMADIISRTINSSKSLYVPDEQYQNMSILYSNYYISICVSNKKIHVSKVKHDPSRPIERDEVRVIADGS